MATHHSNRERLSGPPAAEPSLSSSSRCADRASEAASAEGSSTARCSEHEVQGLAELPLLDEILGRFSDALALVETAHSALDKAQEDETPICSEVVTLHRGLEELKGVYTEFDLTLVHLRRRERA